LKINPNEILRFHKGNKAHPQPEGSELEFRSLDLPISKKRYILLVQIGKEGWDCKSLTGVILSQKGDCLKIWFYRPHADVYARWTKAKKKPL
jgi:hypothetical protein